MKISDQDIKKVCSEGIYKAGEDYFREGRVHIRVRAEDSIVASVDSDKVYNVHIGFNKEGEICETFCTCPYYQTMNSNCKHIVAVLKARKSELEGGELSTLNDNDRMAELLCLSYERQQAEKERMPIRFILNINTNHKRECKYSMSVCLGGRETPISGIESFLDSYVTGRPYKLSKHKVYDREKYYFDSYEEHILNILAEAYQNKVTGSSFYTQKLTAADFGSYTAKRLMPMLYGIDCKIVVNGMPQANIMIKNEDPDILVDLTATDDNINIDVPQSGLALTPDGSWFLYDGDIYQTTEEWRSWFMPIYNALSNESRTQIDFSGSNSVSFAANVLPKLRGQRGVVAQGIENVVVDDKPRFDVYFDRLDDGISAAIVAVYGSIYVRLPSDEQLKEKIVVRDYKDERYLLSLFDSFKVEGQNLYLDGDEEIYDFLTNTIKKVSALAEIHASDSFMNLRTKTAPEITSYVKYNKNIDFFEVGFESDISASEIMGILTSIRYKKPYYRMKNGDFLDIDDVSSKFGVFNNIDFSYNDIKLGKKKLTKYYALYLSSASELGLIKTDADFDRYIEEIKGISAKIPENLGKILRDYQKTAVHWLTQLSRLGLGGILADDMGLGKTLEVIAFVMSERPKLPVLVITPSSITYNWISEIGKFAPSAKAKLIDGPKTEREKLLADISGYDFIITSYPLLRRDISQYAKLEFSYCFIDEAQNIKNPKTLSAKAVKKIQSGACFALSGTPIENSLTELWSIFDFIMPGFLGTHQQFSEKYEKPIVKSDDADAAKNLRAKIKPFIMRRMKYDVLSELPDKIENTFFAELEPEQKKVYLAYLTVARREAKEILSVNGDSMRILALLMRLRQICCHPALIDESYGNGSGKLQLLEELVTEGVAAGHRILIFSQFTSMLGIIQKRLSDNGISCFYLDGRTPAFTRGEMADRFNRGERDVFLVSLKAGGTGLNLIGADMVIHYDPWWNPAVVDQASDRAYRIGQTKAVHVIKLAAKGTIEEQIIKLQEKKREIAEDMIRTNSATLSNLSKDEILELFS